MEQRGGSNGLTAPVLLGPEQVSVVEAAVWAAPSLLNTRPWRLRPLADRVELYAEVARWVPVVDPLGRAVVISCGAALRNLEVALRWLGLHPEVVELPEPADPSHVATVAVRPAADAHERDALRHRGPYWAPYQSLYRAIFRRHSYRGPLAPRPVPPATCVRLHTAGQAPGVTTRLVGEDEVQVVAAVLAAAANLQRGDQRYQADLRGWLRQHRVDHPVTDGLLRTGGPPARAAELARSLARGRLVLVTTVDDGPLDQLRAGRALQNLWLTATGMGLVGSVLSVVLEAPGVRGALVERLGLAGFPQVLLRLGWAEPAR